MMLPHERRKYARIALSVPCRVNWQDQLFEGRTVNLSQGGTCIDIERIPSLPPKGARVQVTIRWRGLYQLSGWVRHYGQAEEGGHSYARFGVELDRGGDYQRFRRMVAALA